MANWTETWRPQYIYRSTTSWNTLVSTFETGEEQRRSKRALSQATFDLQYHALAVAAADAIRAFYDARKGSYEAFNFPSYGELITGTRLTLVEGGEAKDTITDSLNGFVTKGFDANHDVWVAYSGAGNNGIYTVYSVAAGTITLNATQDIADESGNASLHLYKSYSVRFVGDSLEIGYITPTVCTLQVSMIEVL